MSQLKSRIDLLYEKHIANKTRNKLTIDGKINKLSTEELRLKYKKINDNINKEREEKKLEIKLKLEEEEKKIKLMKKREEELKILNDKIKKERIEKWVSSGLVRTNRNEMKKKGREYFNNKFKDQIERDSYLKLCKKNMYEQYDELIDNVRNIINIIYSDED